MENGTVRSVRIKERKKEDWERNEDFMHACTGISWGSSICSHVVCLHIAEVL